MKTILAYLRLMRPANIVTAVADILAGFSLVTWKDYDTVTDHSSKLFFLIIATIGLYGGGVVMNDVADAELDKIERPERSIPSGLASRKGASIFGICLLIFGICAACMVSLLSGVVAFFVALFALNYDFFAKPHKFFGPLNMGLCRGGNLLLGMSASVWILRNCYPLAILPVIYIAAITMISRGEVMGGNKKAILVAGFFYLMVIAGLLFIPFYVIHKTDIFITDAFAILFAALIYQPLFNAFSDPAPMNIRKAVKAGVLALIAMDATISVSFMGWHYALIVLALLPVSVLLAKVFSVT
ncbi:MAG: UbiA-like protein EboC [Bacteroidetes bacterium]|nr:UbiA-like protein EboC [Bacteroidota bacterium]